MLQKAYKRRTGSMVLLFHVHVLGDCANEGQREGQGHQARGQRADGADAQQVQQLAALRHQHDPQTRRPARCPDNKEPAVSPGLLKCVMETLMHIHHTTSEVNCSSQLTPQPSQRRVPPRSQPPAGSWRRSSRPGTRPPRRCGCHSSPVTRNKEQSGRVSYCTIFISQPTVNSGIEHSKSQQARNSATQCSTLTYE
jgi:hypothetical protein